MDRKASLTRTTKETDIKLEFNIDGFGETKVDTGIGIPNERELIDEARRIVSEIGISKRSDKRRAVRNSIFALLCFCIGLITGICAAFLIK